jgi:hypothetical protein
VKCAPPKSVRVKSYTRGAGKRKRRRRRKKTPAGGYWTCVELGSGRVCGVHHRKLTGAVAHRRKLDRAGRDYRARHGGALRRWYVEKRGG